MGNNDYKCCKDCQKRKEACHSACPEAFMEELEHIYNKRNRDRQRHINNALRDIKSDGYARLKSGHRS